MSEVSWKELYTAAMLELDEASLRFRIEAARIAIVEAMRTMANDHRANAVETTWAMTDALQNLKTLQEMELGASAPASSLGPTQAEGKPYEDHVPFDLDCDLARKATGNRQIASPRENRHGPRPASVSEGRGHQAEHRERKRRPAL